MSLSIREVANRKELRKFIYLPEKIHANHETWVHPIYADERRYFNPNRNRAFNYCDTILLLALRGRDPVGRIMGIINHRYNETRDERAARFAYLEAWEDKEVVHVLLDRVEAWARHKNMSEIVGPYGFSDQDPEGFLIEGFEHRATIATYHNFAWMPLFVEERGYEKDIDYVVYKINVPKEIPTLYKRIIERVERKGRFKFLEFRKRRDLEPWIRPAFRLMNECFSSSNIYGFAPLDEEEMDDLAKRFLPIVDPRFLKGAMRGDEVAAFIIGIPDMTEGIRRAKGRLFPFGIFKILRASKKTKQLDLLLGAIKEPYRGLGLDALIAVKMAMAAWEAGIEVIDTHHEMETNLNIRSIMEKLGGKPYKRFRVYKKKM
jgi:hypothetical protein